MTRPDECGRGPAGGPVGGTAGAHGDASSDPTHETREAAREASATRNEGASDHAAVDADGADDASAADWAAFLAEAGWLVRRAHAEAGDLSPEVADRLEAVSDPLIDLTALASLVSHGSPVSLQPQPSPASRARASDVVADPEVRRAALAARIVAGLRAERHAERLRVRAVDGAPPRRPVETRPPVDARLLAAAERRHVAVAPEGVAIAAGAGRLLEEAACGALVPVPEDLPRGRYLALAVTGESMEPLFHAGDTVLVRLGGPPEPGIVVVARDPDHGMVLKEVVAVRADGLELRSLNPAFAPTRVPAADGAVLGTVLLRWCPHARGAARPG